MEPAIVKPKVIYSDGVHRVVLSEPNGYRKDYIFESARLDALGNRAWIRDATWSLGFEKGDIPDSVLAGILQALEVSPHATEKGEGVMQEL